MSFAVDIPVFECFVRDEYLYNLDKAHVGDLTKCRVVGADSVEGRAVGFDILINNGALFSRLPVSALLWKDTDHEQLPLEKLQPWGAFSYSMECHTYAALRESKCRVHIPKRNSAGQQCCIAFTGQYMFTLSWHGISTMAESAVEFKRGHFIRLENGQFCIQPNNRILWFNNAWVTDGTTPRYETNTHDWTLAES